MPQLNLHWFPSEIFWLVITFAALYFVMARFTLPHIGRVIESRNEKIGAELARAEQFRNEAESLERKYKLELEKAHSAANKIITEAENTGKNEAVKQNADLGKILADRLAEAEKKIRSNKEKAVAEMHGHQVEIAKLILDKVANLKIGEKEIGGVISGLTKN